MIIIILILRSQHRIDVSVFSLVAEIIWGHGGHYQADHDEHDHVLPATLESERTNYKSNYSKLCLLVTYRNANPTMKRTWMKQAVKLHCNYINSTPLHSNAIDSQSSLPHRSICHQQLQTINSIWLRWYRKPKDKYQIQDISYIDTSTCIMTTQHYIMIHTTNFDNETTAAEITFMPFLAWKHQAMSHLPWLQTAADLYNPVRTQLPKYNYGDMQ